MPIDLAYLFIYSNLNCVAYCQTDDYDNMPVVVAFQTQVLRSVLAKEWFFLEFFEGQGYFSKWAFWKSSLNDNLAFLFLASGIFQLNIEFITNNKL